MHPYNRALLVQPYEIIRYNQLSQFNGIILACMTYQQGLLVIQPPPIKISLLPMSSIAIQLYCDLLIATIILKRSAS